MTSSAVPTSDSSTQPLLPGAVIESLQARLQEDFTVEAVTDSIGPIAEQALGIGDLDVVSELLRDRHDDATTSLLQFFLLALPRPETEMRQILGTEVVSALIAAELASTHGPQLRANAEIRPYGQISDTTNADSDSSWWVLSDFGADVRSQPLTGDHVLGIGTAALTLAQSIVRDPFTRALDIGTGCGVQALHLSSHCDMITATDLSQRALRYAATTFALSGVQAHLAQGSLLEPVAGEHFDLVVCNPPFVLSPGLQGADALTYRDSGQPADELCAELVQTLPAVLNPGGYAQLLANWAVRADDDVAAPADQVLDWLADADPEVGAWVWQREMASPPDYVRLWLRDGGQLPGSPQWRSSYERWCRWFENEGIVAVGMGLVNLYRNPARSHSLRVAEDVRHQLDQPTGWEVSGWFRRSSWLAETSDEELLHTSLRLRVDVTLEQTAQQRFPSQNSAHSRHSSRGQLYAESEGWQVIHRQLRQRSGMCWTVETDEIFSGFVAGCDGMRTVLTLIAVLALTLGVSEDELITPVVAVLRDLIARGLLEPIPLGTNAARQRR